MFKVIHILVWKYYLEHIYFLNYANIFDYIILFILYNMLAA